MSLASPDTPAIAWRAKSVGVVLEEEDEPTIRIPEFARLLAESICEERVPESSSGSMSDVSLPLVPASAGSAELGLCALGERDEEEEEGGEPCPEPSGLRAAARARRHRARALAAFVVSAALLVVSAIYGWTSGAAPRIAHESTALARSFVGCPAPQHAFARASNRYPALTTKQSTRRMASAKPAPAPRAVPRAPRHALPARPGIIRKAPF